MDKRTKTIYDYWMHLSEEKWKTAEGLYSLKRYSDCLFFCHLTLESLLKSIVVLKTKTHAPLKHDLLELAEMVNLSLDESLAKDLQEISTFNIAGRYDTYKQSFYRKANEKYTEKFFIKTQEIRSWLVKQLKQKNK